MEKESKFSYYKEIDFEEHLHPLIDNFQKRFKLATNSVLERIPKFENCPNMAKASFLLYNTLDGIKEQFSEYDIPIHYNFHFDENVQLNVWITWREYFGQDIWNNNFEDVKNNPKHYNNGDALMFIDYQVLKDTQSLLELLDINIFETCALFFEFRGKFEKIINYYPKIVKNTETIYI